MHHEGLTIDKFKRKAVLVSDAQNLIMPHMHLGDTEWIALAESGGRILAEDVIAPHPYPHFRRSSMDGYAILSNDTKGCSTDKPIYLEVVDEIPCGSLPSIKLVSGTVSRIMTGAKVPDEADAVIMFEMTEPNENRGRRYIQLKREIKPDQNITPVGQELAEGEIILKKGRKLGTGELSVLATFGIHKVPVIKKPRVAIISTGSELLGIDEPLQDGRIRNSNTFMLANQVREAGGEPHILKMISDDLTIAKQRVEEALTLYDVVITTGGVSVGDYDIMADLVTEKDVEKLFNKVTMRPGSVTTAAVKNGKLLFALSGNPGACFVGFELFARPAIGRMLGVTNPFLPEYRAELGTTYSKTNKFTRYVRGRQEIVDGRVLVYPAQLDESNVMITIKDSNVLIVIPPSNESIEAGEMVKVIKLPS
ncbi:molybdopterin molybdotransferase MoeA [Paenibacillus sp. FSL K6-2524]|uniref:molybdopterin molybdotransferase MoeA n=1 Tax=Paenibacillus sp. FSL K6-2524 TaxID=2954516 RepID=UPI0030FD0753